MEIVVRGRNVEVPEHFRQHVWDKVSASDRFDGKLKIFRIDVELFHEKNPRQSGSCQRVEITLSGKGPIIRAEACGPDFYAALDLAAAKLDNRLRRAADRRRVHHGRRTPASVRVTNNTVGDTGEFAAAGALDLDRQLAEGPHVTDLDEHLPGRIVREKQHPATPMTVDQALHEMELVGHDFFLFQCADTGQPTVVYRRHAYDYGLIRLVAVPLNGAPQRAPEMAQPAGVTATV
jgi:ribosomal subunit interface protein